MFNQELFNYLSDQFDIIAIESELKEIESLVTKNGVEVFAMVDTSNNEVLTPIVCQRTKSLVEEHWRMTQIVLGFASAKCPDVEPMKFYLKSDPLG